MSRSPQEIADELIKTKHFRDAGVLSTTTAVAILQAIPIVGGPLGAAVQDIGNRLFDAGIEEKFVDLCTTLEKWAPDIALIESLTQRVEAIEAFFAGNAIPRQQLESLLKALHPQINQWVANNEGGFQRFYNVVITKMTVHVNTSAAGQTEINRMSTSHGDVHFNSTGGGHQVVNDSIFQGSDTAAVGLHGVGLTGGIALSGAGGNPALGLKSGSAIALGPNAQIAFFRSGNPPKKD